MAVANSKEQGLTQKDQELATEMATVCRRIGSKLTAMVPREELWYCDERIRADLDRFIELRALNSAMFACNLPAGQHEVLRANCNHFVHGVRIWLQAVEGKQETMRVVAAVDEEFGEKFRKKLGQKSSSKTSANVRLRGIDDGDRENTIAMAEHIADMCRYAGRATGGGTNRKTGRFSDAKRERIELLGKAFCKKNPSCTRDQVAIHIAKRGASVSPAYISGCEFWQSRPKKRGGGRVANQPKRGKRTGHEIAMDEDAVSKWKRNNRELADEQEADARVDDIAID